MRTGPTLALLLFAGAAALTAQAPVPARLGAAERRLPVEFSQVTSLIELRDGRLLIADRMDERVVVADLDKGTTAPVGGRGSGPREYRLPGRLVQWLADSVLLYDEGNGRLAVIGPGPAIQRSFRPDVPGVPSLLVPRAVDGEGRIYAEVPRWAAQGFEERGDSVPVVRVDLTTRRAEVVTWVIATLNSPPSNAPRIPYIPFSPRDVWTGDAAGRLAVVRSGDYHVEWLAAGRVVARGAPVPHTVIPVTEADRLAYTRRFTEGSSIGGRGGPDATPSGLSPIPKEMLTDREIRRTVAASTFAPVKPPFTDALPQLSPEGRLWVQRSVAAGAAVVWDVFDASGRLTRRVELPERRRLAALGRGVAYLVAVDEDGIEWVERYRVP